MSRARRRENCSRPTPSSSPPSRASARSTCMPWRTPTGRLRVPTCLQAARGGGGGVIQGRAALLSPVRTGGRAVPTDNGRESCGTERHAYEFYLDLNGTERRTKVQTPTTNGFVERFNTTILDELFRIKTRGELLRDRRDAAGRPKRLLPHYHTERPHLARNHGRRPIETINEVVSQDGYADTSWAIANLNPQHQEVQAQAAL